MRKAIADKEKQLAKITERANRLKAKISRKLPRKNSAESRGNNSLVNIQTDANFHHTRKEKKNIRSSFKTIEAYGRPDSKLGTVSRISSKRKSKSPSKGGSIRQSVPISSQNISPNFPAGTSPLRNKSGISGGSILRKASRNRSSQKRSRSRNSGDDWLPSRGP